MPYITRDRRLEASTHPETPGELNFAVTVLIRRYLLTKGLSYSHCNDVLGALEGAKAEFYRRVVVPYEDQKIAENGDVYPKVWRAKG